MLKQNQQNDLMPSKILRTAWISGQYDFKMSMGIVVLSAAAYR